MAGESRSAHCVMTASHVSSVKSAKDALEDLLVVEWSAAPLLLVDLRKSLAQSRRSPSADRLSTRAVMCRLAANTRTTFNIHMTAFPAGDGMLRHDTWCVTSNVWVTQTMYY